MLNVPTPSDPYDIYVSQAKRAFLGILPFWLLNDCWHTYLHKLSLCHCTKDSGMASLQKYQPQLEQMDTHKITRTFCTGKTCVILVNQQLFIQGVYRSFLFSVNILHHLRHCHDRRRRAMGITVIVFTGVEI